VEIDDGAALKWPRFPCGSHVADQHHVTIQRILLFFAALGLAFVAACKGSPDSTPWCSDTKRELESLSPGSVTWHRDVAPIFDAKCVYCHREDGIGPFSLTTYDVAHFDRKLIKTAVVDRSMPPWQAAPCCSHYAHDWGLTDAEIAKIVRWVDDDGPAGDPKDAPATPPPPVIGLPRADVTLTMPVAYTPAPPAGSTDDNRCFLLDWPYDREVYVTGFNPKPGTRSVVHHLVVATINGDNIAKVAALEGADGRPGIDCNNGVGDLDIRDVVVLGGGLLGGEFPGGLGKKVPPHSKIVINIHYSTAHALPRPDRTGVELQIADHATEFKGMAVANIAWLAGDGMKIDAGDEDAVFFYKMEPFLYTRGKTVQLRSVTAHMHTFGSRFVMRIIRANGDRECLIEIPHWVFGWEQPYWFETPKVLKPGDKIYVECHFDNSAARQPKGQAPRDIAWGGNNQDMCAGFLSYTEGGP
jgi:hypothetical protein